MRQVTVKEIRELTDGETEQLLTDYNVRQEIIAWANECETDSFSDIFYYISSSLSDWSIDMPFNSYIRVNDYQEFYSGIKEMYESYGVFCNTYIIERLDSLYNKYYTTVDANEFMKHMKPLEQDIAIELGGYATYYYSFTVLELETDYIMVWLENNYDKECIIDGDNVTLLNY